ncbi:MAG: HDIG domain-containing protein [Thermodesulfobacteriota bacterium]|nr:HDIG domain-containing protein [Thermodesulfobacteriota bacterium]
MKSLVSGIIDRNRMLEYPAGLRECLANVAMGLNARMFVTGGAVRSWLTGCPAKDLDITVDTDAISFARVLASKIGGAFVMLDDEEGVARVVRQDIIIDVSEFREGTKNITDDLCKRDFTINAMAVALDPADAGLQPPFKIVDPTDGLHDLENGIIRTTSSDVFKIDPLRLIRAYRFTATLGALLESETEELIVKSRDLLRFAAPERISHELHQIMESSGAYRAMSAMAASGLLFVVFPELEKGVNQVQPISHHLDVFGHSMAALGEMEKMIRLPDMFFPGRGHEFNAYLENGMRVRRLKWAALFHDLGKPDTFRKRDGRITFYGHDRAGADQFIKIGRRLRWTREDIRAVALFIKLHMWLFHLNNARLKTGIITSRACLKLVKAAGEDIEGLFLLAIADSLACKGPGRPLEMEEGLCELYEQVDQVNRENIKPVLLSPRLLTGHDLKNIFGLKPGPIFGKILSGLEEARVSRKVRTRDEALHWVESFLVRQNE